MLQWLKRFFTKKIGLPLWFFVLGRPTSYEKFEEYSEALDRISKGLLEGKNVYFMINGQPAVASMKDGKPSVRLLDKHEYKIEF